MTVEIEIDSEMIDWALKKAPSVKVNRTKSSQFDTVYGILGEFAFAKWFYGDWKELSQVDTKGKADFQDQIEVKTSAFPYSTKLNLLVREDYAKKRKCLKWR